MRFTSWCALPDGSSIMDGLVERGVTTVPPPLPPKARAKPCAVNAGSTVFVSPSPCSPGLQVHSPHNTTIVAAAPRPDTAGHVVKIKINPEHATPKPAITSVQLNVDTVSIPVTAQPANGCVRISVGSGEQEEEMLQRPAALTDTFTKNSVERSSPYFFCNGFACATVTNATMVMSSGQCSPSDTLDSGTCSDLDGTPPPLPKKKSVTVTVIGAQHKRAGSLTSSGAEADSDDNDSNLSCDSLNSTELNAQSITEENKQETVTISSSPTNSVPKSPPTPPSFSSFNENNTSSTSSAFLPQGLLQDIRDRSAKLSQQPIPKEEPPKTQLSNPEKVEQLCPAKAIIAVREETQRTTLVNESTYEERKLVEKQKETEAPVTKIGGYTYETDKYYKFHLNENVIEEDNDKVVPKNDDTDQETFAGYRDFLGCNGSSTIRSAKGTVRGVKNRVRAGIATFLQIQSTTKSYKEKDAGKVVVYTTTMGIVRNTYHACGKVKQILRTHLVKFEERDVFMSNECQAEIRDRMRCEHILIPQVFVDGQHIGDAETIERLNESGELRRILKPYKSPDACTTCSRCGGYRLLPCPVCNGSKKSVHRNHFTTEFVALKCMNCDEVGLVRCSTCS